MDYKEYSRLRDIAHKRIGRLGLDVHIPTVKEVRSAGNLSQAAADLKKFLESGTTKKEFKAQPKQVANINGRLVIGSLADLKKERRKAQQREASRRYREKKKRIAEKDSKSGFLKGAETLGLHLRGNEEKEAFVDYMNMRFSQGLNKQRYNMMYFVEDFIKLKSQGYTPNQIFNDFNQFLADRAETVQRYTDMKGTDALTVNDMLSLFINRDDPDVAEGYSDLFK